MKGFTPYLIKIFFCLAALGGTASCSEKKPANVLSKAEMVQILEEMYLAEEKVSRLAISRDSSKEVFEVVQEKVFENTGVTDSLFQKSFDYYMEHPKEMELIYTALVDTLQLREQRAPLRTDQQ